MTRSSVHPHARRRSGALLAWVLPATFAASGCYDTMLVAHPPETDGGQPDARADAGRKVDAEVTPDAGPTALQFADVWCDPPVHLGVAVEENTIVQCDFTVQDEESAVVTLGCEDGTGNPIDCNGGWPNRDLEPTAPTPAPVHGSFIMHTINMAGERAETVWVATDDRGHEARYDLAFDVVHEQPVDPPEIYIDCGGGDPHQVGVVAGGRLQCELTITHTMPFAPVVWQVFWPNHPDFTNLPVPTEGSGTGVFPWSWQTTPAEAGLTYHFYFQARLNLGSIAIRELVVDVF